MTLRENENKNMRNRKWCEKRAGFAFLPCNLLACPRVNNKYAQNDPVSKEIKDNEKETQSLKRRLVY